MREGRGRPSASTGGCSRPEAEDGGKRFTHRYRGRRRTPHRQPLSQPRPSAEAAAGEGACLPRRLPTGRGRRPAALGSAAQAKTAREAGGQRPQPGAQRQPAPRTRPWAAAVPSSGSPGAGRRAALPEAKEGRRGLGRPLTPPQSPAAQPGLPTEARPCFSRRFPLGVSATASDNSGAVYTVGPRTPPPPPLPPFLHPSAVADSAAATSSAAASSLWSIFQPPNPEKQRLQPRRQETPPQLPGG